MRNYDGDCCHYDDGYDDGFADGKGERQFPEDVSFADVIYEWSRQQRDDLAEAGFVVAAAIGSADIERLEKLIEERRLRLLTEYAAATAATSARAQAGAPEKPDSVASPERDTEGAGA